MGLSREFLPRARTWGDERLLPSRLTRSDRLVEALT